MLKYKALIKPFVVICVFICCMYGDTAKEQVVVLCPLMIMNHLKRKRFFLFWSGRFTLRKNVNK